VSRRDIQASSTSAAIDGDVAKTLAKAAGMGRAYHAGMSRSSFRDLEVWQLGIELADFVYTMTDKFPRHELYGLTGSCDVRA
jgi:hypothetical protein